MKPENLTKLSKFISMILRHKPEAVGLRLDDAGWVGVEELLAAIQNYGTPITAEQLNSIVSTDEKQRYQFSPDKKRIRANQGHSIHVELGHRPQEPPELLYHGTASRFIESIRKTGLEKRERQHVHLSASQETAKSVGQRYGQPVILVVDAARMYCTGYEFFCSDNNVWLTDHVPVEYISFPDE